MEGSEVPNVAFCFSYQPVLASSLNEEWVEWCVRSHAPSRRNGKLLNLLLWLRLPPSLSLFSSPSPLYPLVHVTHLYGATAFSLANPSSPPPPLRLRLQPLVVCPRRKGAQRLCGGVGNGGSIWQDNIQTPRINLNNMQRRAERRSENVLKYIWNHCRAP